MKYFWYGLLVLIIVFLIALMHWRSRDWLLEKKFDLQNPHPKIEETEEVKSVLNSLEKISYKELPKEYKDYTKSNKLPFEKHLKSKTYYRLTQADFNRVVVGQFRIKDFVVKDRFYKKALFNRSLSYFWLIDENLLSKIVELRKLLSAQSYDPNAFWIRHGHRHPQYNEQINGASRSRHIYGEAADLVIQDINKDGKYSERDKQIVLDIVDKLVIANRGGVGRYPGTRTIHIDVRGYRARWDTY